eukprot:s555_g6.t1
MDQHLSFCQPGDLCSLVARVKHQLDYGLYECDGISPPQSFMLSTPHEMHYGIHTLYQLEVLSKDPMCLGFQAASQSFRKRDLPAFEKVTLFDLCGGIGGFTMGSHPIGFETLAILDSNALACETLRANFQVPIIHGNVSDISTIQELHALKTEDFSQITGGFPCQPFSRQGDLQGLRDQRGTVLSALLRCAWLLQVQSLLLECVDNVLQFKEIQDQLDSFAEIAGMNIYKLVFDLKDQWPVRRNRFWCMMLVDDIPPMSLPGWPTCSLHRTLADVMPLDARWPVHHEHELAWDQLELSAYSDTKYGKDIRILLPHHQAPTMLHSWSNVFRACPCGCRDSGFSLHRLLQGGARGFGLLSALTQSARHLHAEEGALLCTVPLDFCFPASQRAALCQLGQIAAPLQVLWLQSHLLAHLQQHFWLSTSLQPLDLIQSYKHGLLLQRLQRWILASMDLPRQLQLQLDGTIMDVVVHTPVTAADVERAETALIGRGHYVTVWQNGFRLPHWCQLHPGAIYHLVVHHKRQAAPSALIAGCSSGSSVSDCLASSVAFSHSPPGLGDTHIWAGLKMMLDLRSCQGSLDLPRTIYPFRAEQFLRLSLPPGLLGNWQSRFHASTGQILVIFEHANHWTLLVGDHRDHLHWRHFDGFPGTFLSATSEVAFQVAVKMAQCLDIDMGDFQSYCLWHQTRPTTCGTLALLHASHVMQLDFLFHHLDESDLHHLFSGLCQSTASYTANGKHQHHDSLLHLLESKGVPAAKVQERAALIRDKLGQTIVQQALRAANPWSALKAAASKPGRMLRLVTEDELQDYINARAQTKHGAKVHNAKQKKQASLHSGPVQLDPEDFRLEAQHFQDDDGKPVPQITFQDVEANKHGIALCTTTMAKHFLEPPSKISLHALALLLVDSPSNKLIADAQLEPIIFPAICSTTDEHTIIMGHVLQLGDQTVKRKMAGKESEPEKLDTQVIKFQVFKDQLDMEWDSFIASPVRHLITMMEALQLCKGQRCGLECAKHHPGLDESLDAVVMEVWSRSFIDDNGKKVEPSSATTFTVFMRIPESAVLKALAASPVGVYIEPRGTQPREHDDKFRVIWLPGASFTEAQHQSRTYSKSIALVRLKTKYGIRVKKGDEAAAWAKLRPGVEFVDMSIQKIFEIFPIPHGTQRATINKILADWSWKARALQPGRGNFHHMAWRVGSADLPPATVMTAFGADVIVKEVKDLHIPAQKPTIYAPVKTQKHLREQPSSSTAKASTSSDPWIDNDPWGGYTKTTASVPPSRPYKAELQDQIRETVNTALKEKAQDWTMGDAETYTTENEQRFTALESGLQELKNQNGQFLQWFNQTGERLQQNDSLMQDVQDTVQQHASALQLMSASMTKSEQAIGEVQHTLNSHQQEIHSLSHNFGTAMRSMKDELSGELMQPATKIKPIWLLLCLWFCHFINPAAALQSGASFARHSVLSSATSVDRDNGSGKTPDLMQEPMFPCAAGTRFGEALHPGPDATSDYWLTVGVANPGGLRAKEDMVLSWGPGIWTLTETQLSQVTAKTTERCFRAGGHKLNRRVRSHFGHPAPLRQGSQWAGKNIGLRAESCWVNDIPITVGGFYGYAQGPTWPQARQHSDSLLETFTREVVIGMQGVRLLVGDFNQEPGALLQQQLWTHYGWQSVQQFGEQALGHVPLPTCKHSTQPDQIWASPEALRLLRLIQVHEHFADHCTLEVKLQLPSKSIMISKWPRPAPLPWDSLETTNWSPTCHVDYEPGRDTTDFLRKWATSFESAVDEQIQVQGQPPLKQNCYGRAQRLYPARQEQHPPICKPSREGEVELQSSLTGAAVRCWFKQLRRLQSLCHAVKAAKQSTSAVCYRASLWTAIVHAPGFHPTFCEWWRQRDSPCDGAPVDFPDSLPTAYDEVHVLYLDFLHHFRKFESWHNTQRQISLKAKYEGSLSSIFRDLRDEPKGSIDHIWKEVTYQVLATDPDSGQIMLDREIYAKHDSLWYHEGCPVRVTFVDGVVCTVSNVDTICPEDEIVQRIFLSDINEILDSFTQHWQPRWNNLNAIPAADWLRIVQFTQAYMPQMPFHLPDLDVDMWLRSASRFKTQAARGPDGFSRADLKQMPVEYVAPLLSMFHHIEHGEDAWPAQLLFGTIIGTAKRKLPHEECHFRPITLFSMLFRNWSKLRTRHMLHQLSQYMPVEALGFMPRRETAEVWLLLQAQVEVMLSYDAPLGGLSSDVKRAFNPHAADKLL